MFFLIAWIFDYYDIGILWSVFGILISINELVHILVKTKDCYPIGSLFLFILMFQCIVSPWIDYITIESHFKYFMRVPEEDYMGFSVPAIWLFSIGIKSYKSEIEIDALSKLDITKNFIIKLVTVGIIATFLINVAPASIRFILYLLALLKFVGAIMYYWRIKSSKRFVPLLLMFFYLLIESANTGFFHELILWLIFVLPFVAVKERLTLVSKTVASFVIVFSIFVLQAIKFDFRDSRLEDREQNIENLASLFAIGAGSDIFVSEVFNEINVRFNQGWIVSSIMKNVPMNQEYAGGSTITEAISASIIPRFLFSNKKTAGGRDNFQLYTGLFLGESTSMGMGLLGEAFANFGNKGGILFFLMWGILLGLVIKKIDNLSKLFPQILFFIPFLFFQAIKAETELVVVLNHMVKASILLYLLFKIMKWRRFNQFNDGKLDS